MAKIQMSYRLTPALTADLKKLYGQIGIMNRNDQEICNGIITNVLAHDAATFKQLQVLGYIYKKYLQDDEYVHHNWQIWKKAKTRAA